MFVHTWVLGSFLQQYPDRKPLTLRREYSQHKVFAIIIITYLYRKRKMFIINIRQLIILKKEVAFTMYFTDRREMCMHAEERKLCITME